MNQYQQTTNNYPSLYSSTPTGYYAMPACSSFSQPPQLQRQKAQVPGPTIVVQDNDVLMGRGGKNNLHIGNEKLRQMAREKSEQYGNADKKEKSIMSIELVAQVHALSPPGRFLKKDPVTLDWQLVPVELAREKASQCLRDAVSKRKNRKRSSSPSSSNMNTSEESETTSPSQKRRRTQELDNEIISDESHATIMPIPSVVSVLSRPTPVSSDSSSSMSSYCPAGLKVVSHANNSYPKFDFELFDADSLLGDDSLDHGLDVSDFDF